MSEPLSTPLRRWCMAAAGACLLPLLLQVPAGLALALGTIATLGYVFDRRWPGLLRMAVVVMVMGYLLFTFGYNLGRDTGTALLAALLAVKPGETRTLRDARSLLGFSLFAPFAAFLQDQGPLVLLLAMLALGLLLVVLAMLTEHRPGAAPPRFDAVRGRDTLRAVMIALPLALLFGEEALEYRLRDAGAKVIVTNGFGLARLKTLRARLPALQKVISIEGAGPDVIGFHAVVEGRSDVFEIAESGPDTPALMIYTSGTTGPPKGALISTTRGNTSGRSSAHQAASGDSIRMAGQRCVTVLWLGIPSIGASSVSFSL